MSSGSNRAEDEAKSGKLQELVGDVKRRRDASPEKTLGTDEWLLAQEDVMLTRVLQQLQAKDQSLRDAASLKEQY